MTSILLFCVEVIWHGDNLPIFLTKGQWNDINFYIASLRFYQFPNFTGKKIHTRIKMIIFPSNKALKKSTITNYKKNFVNSLHKMFASSQKFIILLFRRVWIVFVYIFAIPFVVYKLNFLVLKCWACFVLSVLCSRWIFCRSLHEE